MLDWTGDSDCIGGISTMYEPRSELRSFVGARGTYLVCKNIIKAFMSASGGNSHEKDLDEEPHQSEDVNP